MRRARLGLLIPLALVGGALSGLLLLEHYGVDPAVSAVEQLCGPETESGCEKVSRSPYSAIGPVSLAGLGVIFYGALGLLTLFAIASDGEIRRVLAALALLLVGAAVVADVALLGVQAFAIGAFCGLCLVTYGVNVGALIVLLPARAGRDRVQHSLRGVEGRTALASWALGSAILLVTVVVAERMLAAMEAARPSSVLAAPLVPPSSPPVSPPEAPSTPQPEEVPEASVPDAPDAADAAAKTIAALRDELRQARAHSQRLQQILDDPQKFQDYQAQKAAREFEQAGTEDLALTGIPFKGSADAPIKVVEFSDFLCPYCRQLAGAFESYVPQSANRVAVYFKNFPLDRECNNEISRTVHPGACQLALGAICAADQGRFWPYHDRVFSEAPQVPGRADVLRLGAAAGVEAERFQACLDSAAASERLQADIREARRVAVSATPTVFVNGKRLARLNDFLQAIAIESERLGLPPLSYESGR